jgi:serine/threonine-protein kinase
VNATTLDKYRLVAKLAEGGMGEIVLASLATSTGFEKLFVIKRLRSHLKKNRHATNRFLQEARIAARLSHANVLQVHDLIEADDEYALVMEYLEGLPLNALMAAARAADQAIDVRIVGSVLQQACEGLFYAHTYSRMDGTREGIIHRDVSPHNLFLTKSGLVKVLDFGVAKLTREREDWDREVTPAGQVVGKFAYMSPEQIEGKTLGPATDVYALGAVLYEMLTLDSFAAAGDEAAARVGPIHAGLAQVVARATAGSPDDRFASAREMGQAILEALRDEGGLLPQSQLAIWMQEHYANELIRQQTKLAHLLKGGRAAHVPSLTEMSTLHSSGLTAYTVTRTIEDPPVEAAGDAAAPSQDTISLPFAPPEHSAAAASAKAPGSPRNRWGFVALGIAIAAALGAIAMPLLSREDAAAAQVPTQRAAAAFDAQRPLPPTGAIDAGPASRVRGQIDAAAPPVDSGPPAPPRKRRKKPTPAPERGVGYLTIDSFPFAEIYLRDKRLGTTPLFRVELPAGRHRIKAILQSGKSRHLKIHIRPGKETRPRRLIW